MRYALYVESTNKYSAANTQDYGWYTGITYKVKGIAYPVCDAEERPNKRTKIYKSLYTAKIVGESLIRKCPFIDGYRVAKLFEKESNRSE